MNRVKDFSYIAGFFDGEGCITSTIVKKKNRDTHHVYSIIIITNTNLEVLKYIQKVFGFGRINEKKYEKHRKTRCWAYTIDSSSEILEFLQSIRPYLRVKDEQADLAVEYLKSRLSKTLTNSNTPLTLQEVSCIFNIRLLTQRTPGEKIKYKNKLYSLEEFIVLLNSNRTKNFI